MAPDASIECPNYRAAPGTRRCTSYMQGGGCQRDDTFMCTEWLRKNAPAARRSEPQASRDLFGHMTTAQPSRAKSAATAVLASKTAPEPIESIPRPITEAQIVALEMRGLELCVRSEAIGELWLVPSYTDVARNEVTFRDAATIAAMCTVFPGAEVSHFKSTSSRRQGA